jgi:hypothetical protein
MDIDARELMKVRGDASEMEMGSEKRSWGAEGNRRYRLPV